MPDNKHNQKQLQINYYKNMEFFRSNNPSLFDALKQPPQRYNLHIDSHGLNIINLQKHTLFYPLCDIESSRANPKYSMIPAHSDLSKEPLKNPKWHLTLHFNPNLYANFTDEKKLFITAKHCNDMYKTCIRTRVQEDFITTLSDNFARSKFLPFTCIYGLMGGLFLQDLLDSGYTFHSLIIYESDIDLFRISLYFLDFELLFSLCGGEHLKNATLIMVSKINLPLLSAFIRQKRVSNSLMNLSLKQYESVSVKTLREHINKEQKSLSRGWGSFEDESIGFKNAIKNLGLCRILDSRIKRCLAPICVVGNGPSLDLCLDFLKSNAERMIIFSCGTALKVLRHHGIKPDFQVEIERVGYLSDVLREARLEDIPLIFAQMTDCDAVNISVESYCFMRGGSASGYLFMSKRPDSTAQSSEVKKIGLKSGEINNNLFELDSMCLDSIHPHTSPIFSDDFPLVVEFSAPFVGNAGVALASILGSDVILCGLDCGYIKGFAKHSKHSYYGDEKKSIPQGSFEVKGSKELRVFSSDLFYMSAKNIESAIRFYKTNHVVNIGYGADFDGTLSLKPSEFTLKDIDKNKQLEAIKANFKSFSLSVDIDEILDIVNEYVSRINEIIDEIKGQNTWAGEKVQGAEFLANSLRVEIDPKESIELGDSKNIESPQQDSKKPQKKHINISHIYTLIDKIESYLHLQIKKKENRKSIILLEGSTLHLCHSLLLSHIFANRNYLDSCYSYEIIMHFKTALNAIRDELKNEIQK